MAIIKALKQAPVMRPASTTILVTGATGFVASHIILQALELGYHVRGTARNAERAQLTKKLYNNHPNYSVVVVADLSSTDTSEIAAAMSGVDSVIHTASDTTYSPDPHKVITPVVDSTVNILTVAAKEPSVKRFTLTSSSVSVVTQLMGGTPESVITTESWNDKSVEQAWGSNPDGGAVYAASKTEGEKAFWAFISRAKPAFVANAVLPNLNFGTIFPGGQGGGSGGLVSALYQNQVLLPVPPMHYVNVDDTARLHLIAAVLDDSVSDQRIFAFAGEFNWNDVIDIVARARPEKVMTVQKDPALGRDHTQVPKEQSIELLRRWFGQEGYTPLEQSVQENLVGVQ